jgi:hypothetical protein
MVETGSYIPVYTSDIISVLIFPDLTESNTPALKGTVIFACKNMPA